jgi:hypothetical protein
MGSHASENIPENVLNTPDSQLTKQQAVPLLAKSVAHNSLKLAENTGFEGQKNLKTPKMKRNTILQRTTCYTAECKIAINAKLKALPGGDRGRAHPSPVQKTIKI